MCKPPPSKVSPFTTTYGIFGELKSVTLEDTTLIEYKHNANHQRVAKYINKELKEKYLWLNLTTLLATYDKENNLINRYSYTNDRVPTTMEYNNQTYHLLYNHQGSLRAVVDQEGTIIKELHYDSFGIITLDTNPDFKVNLGFAGGLYDEDTKLTRFGYRDYDAQTGKWTAKDPIGFSGGDTNLYGYVLQDPVGFVDPSGLTGMSKVSVGIGLFFAGKKWYDAIDNLKDKAEIANLCRNVYNQLDYDRTQINNSCMSSEDKLDLLRKSADTEKELQKICLPYMGIGN